MQEIEFQLPHLKLRGLSNGKTNLPVILCLHGWLDNAASFLPLNGYLEHYHVIAIDLPGHGLSDHKSQDAYYHFIDWVSDIYSLFEDQGWGSIHIVGHSMGAMIASAFAAAFPEKVTSLVLIDSIGFITLPIYETAQQLRAGVISRDTLQHKKRRYLKNEYAAVIARQRVGDLSFDDAQILVKRNLLDTDDGLIWRYDHKLQLTSPYRLSKEQAVNLIQSIQSPCLLICGKSGADFVKQSLDDYQPLFNIISCYYLFGGHHVHMENPEQVAALLNTFLN